MFKFDGKEYPDVKLPCNRENMTKLAEALESGKYQQATDALRDGDKFCCLGVACEISGVGRWEGGEYVTTTDSSDQVLPWEVARDFLGVDPQETQLRLTGTAVPVDIYDGDRWIGAAAMNDGGYDFKAIAAQIRKVYLAD